MKDAQEEVIQALFEANQAYLAKYGFIFIICATGKSASEMLEQLNDRMNHNSLDFERAVAAGEQNKITQIRLNKLLAEL
jgi:2-oxo-4-hydroxy-4-carboxy-5-ureidoimidazoline decarboxylase